MMDTWDGPDVKAFLRLTSQKLGQLQERNDAQGQIVRRDIATLLRQENIGLARAKAQTLIERDASSDVLEVLEMYIGMLLEHFGQLEQNSPTPIVAEAASTIVFAAPRTDSKELNTVRDMLIQRLGPDFARAAIDNSDNVVSPRVTAALSAPPPSLAKLDAYLSNLANAYNVNWEPEFQRQDVVNPLSEILDPQLTPVVDLPRLRKLCSKGIPDEPAWLRPRLWKIFLGFLPVLKSSWASEHQKYRDSYYDLVRRLLCPIAQLPPPSKTSAPSDALLLAVHQHILNVSPVLFMGLDTEPEAGELCPLNLSTTDGIRIDCARTLDSRLNELLTARESITTTPEIRVESDADQMSTTFVHDPSKGTSTTFLPSRPLHASNVHPSHTSALLRLLYLHCSINPGTRSPYVPSLLVPMYSIMRLEVEPLDISHIEADTFWLFEMMLGEFSELEDEEGGQIWPKKLSERLAWADTELSDNLHAKGLDPALPHYSYRWLAPLLTQTLPFSSFITIWDVLFTCASRDKQANPKIDYLLDICTAMLVRARNALTRLGQGASRSPGLWTDETAAILPPPPPPRAWGFETAFVDGLLLLQRYPIDSVGGMESILQTAAELSKKRIDAEKASKPGLSLGERLKVTMWKGFTNQVASPYGSPDRSPSPDEEFEHTSADESSSDDGNSTEKPSQASLLQTPGLTTRLANTVWRGITNQSSMESPPSPLPPPSPTDLSPNPLSKSLTNHESDIGTHSADAPSGTLGFWRYAERFKDSDTVATLSKVSSNWRAKSLLPSWGSKSTPNSPMMPGSLALSDGTQRAPQPRYEDHARRGSLPPTSSVYSPPPRPAFFRPPRDSMMPHSRKGLFSLPNSPENTDSESGFTSRAQSLQASLMALTSGSSSEQPPRKSGPRPLLLGSSSVVSSSPHQSRSAMGTPTSEFQRGPAALRHLHRDSQSSISSLSLSPNDNLVRSRQSDHGAGWDSDTLSRVVPLNRKSVSPMAPRSQNRRPRSGSSSATSSDKAFASPALATGMVTAEVNGWAQVNSPTVTSPSAPKTPASITGDPTMISVMEDPDSNTLQYDLDNAIRLDQSSRKIVHRKTPPRYYADDNSDPSLTPAIPRSARTKTRRSTRPGNLRLHDPFIRGTEPTGPSPNSLAVEWPGEYDWASTPRASNFESEGQKPISPIIPRSPRRTRKISGKLPSESSDARPRKVSNGSRSRKSSDVPHGERDSAAEEGDDEGYDDLLSAYESETGSKPSH